MNATAQMTAREYANAHENVIVRYAGNGCPAGQDIAWVPPETDLPFDLSEITGTVGDDGQFKADNLSGASGWKYSDLRGNLIYAVWLRVDPAKWQAEYDEFYGDETAAE